MITDSDGRKFFNDPLRVYDFNYRVYVFTGFWQCKIDILWKRILFRIYQSVLVLVYSLTVISFVIDAVSVRHDLDKLSYNMTSSILVFVTITKISMLKRRGNSMETVLKRLDDHLQISEDSEEEKQILRKRAELILNMDKLLYGLLVICYTLRVMADTAFDTRAYLIPLPFKEKFDDYYEIMYAQQVIAITHFLIVVISHDMLIYGVVNRYIAHFEILQNSFHNIKRLYAWPDYGDLAEERGKSEERREGVPIKKTSPSRLVDPRARNVEGRVKELLRKSIKHHQGLLEEVSSFSKIYSQPLVVQACGAVLLIGIVAIKILFLSNRLTPLLVQQVVYVGITLINILYLCSFGTELTTKSVTAANALYDTPWFEMSQRNRKTVHFALARLMAVPKLRGGSLVVINRVTYLKFLRTSYNMVVVLRNLY